MPTNAGENSHDTAMSVTRPTANSGETRRPAEPEFRDAMALAAIRETAQIPSHLAFLDEVLGRYPMRPERSQLFRNELARLKQRFEDPKLYLGVIGELSAGKSTLINALIGDEAARAGILQGPTSATTLLQYGPQLDAEVLLENGHQERFSRRRGAIASKLLSGLRGWSSRNSGRAYATLVEWIHRYTSRETDAQQVMTVTIEHPVAVLKDGLVIVDTPGLNAEKQRHVAATLKAVRDTCDAFIVALPATSPTWELLVSFLRTHLPGAVHRCLFVITKVDLLRNPAEEDRVRKNVKARLAAELKSSLPSSVFSCAPEIALSILQGKDPNVGRTCVLPAESVRAGSEQFETVRQQLLQAVRRHRFVVVLESIATSVRDLLVRVEQCLGQCQQAYRTRHEALQKQRIRDLESFIQEGKSLLGTRFREQTASIDVEVEGWLTTSKDQLLQVLRSAIFATPDRPSLESVLSTVPARGLRKLQELVELKFNELAGRVMGAAREQQEAFEVEFHKTYKMFATLGGQLNVGAVRPGIVTATGRQTISAADTATRKVTTKSGFEGGKIAGELLGLFVGRELGGFWGDVVGRLSGALLEKVSGKLFGKSITKLHQSTYDKVAQVLEESFLTLRTEFCRELGKFTAQAEHRFLSAIDAYQQQYAAPVTQMIQRDQAERERLASLHRQATHDRQRLANRSRLLNRIRQECVTIQKNGATG